MSEPWSYDCKRGRVNDAAGKPVAFIAARRQTVEDPFASKVGGMIAAAPDLYAALDALSHAIAVVAQPELSQLVATCHTALAKAEGRS